MYGKKYQGPARAAYVFDTTGKLTAVIEKVDAAEHGKQVLDVLKNAQ
jgi:peroxiredoxin